MTTTPRRLLSTVLGAALALTAAAAEAAPAPWLEVESPHFTVITNSGEKQGRRVAWQFEQIRGVLTRWWPWAKVDAGKPFVVFAARDEATLRTLGPQYWEGKRARPQSFWTGGRDRFYIALRTDLSASDAHDSPYQSAYWCYASAVFERSFPGRIPSWFGRGMAEVMSNTSVRDEEVDVGRPLHGNVATLREQGELPLAALLAADASALQQDARTAHLFDAQAWSLVHFLMFGGKGAHLPKLNAFHERLLRGVDPAVATQNVFGDMTPLYAATRAYVQQGVFQSVRLPLSVDVRQEAFAVRPLGAPETAAWRGHFLVAMGRPNEARAAAAEARQGAPALPAPWEIEAELADREGNRAAAREAFTKAADAGSTRAHVHYRLAQLEWTPSPDDAASKRIEARLEKARALDPGDANVLSYLSQLRTGAEALSLAEQAVTIAPAESYHRAALARALHGVGRGDEAAKAAREALAAADSDSDRDHAQKTFAAVSRAPAAGAPVRPAGGTAPAAVSGSQPPGPGAVSVTTGVVSGNLPPGWELGGDASSVNACFNDQDDAACAKAAPALQTACDQGGAIACRSIGSLHDGGFGIPMNKARAATAYDRGCRAGDPGSCARYAVLQFHGSGVARDPGPAMSTLQRLCKQGVDDACVGWGAIMKKSPDPAELAAARKLFGNACNRGYAEGCRLLQEMK